TAPRRPHSLRTASRAPVPPRAGTAPRPRHSGPASEAALRTPSRPWPCPNPPSPSGRAPPGHLIRAEQRYQAAGPLPARTRRVPVSFAFGLAFAGLTTRAPATQFNIGYVLNPLE